MTKLFRYQSAEDGARLGLETAEGRFDATQIWEKYNCGSIASWLAHPHPMAPFIGSVRKVSAFDPVPADAVLLPPVDTQEVWAAGVTYLRSKVARMEESAGGGDFYDKVYDADRPELFFKANPQRVVCDGQPIRLRRDSIWNVPEPEMTLVLSSSGNIVGVTIGNDVSSRSIEGENPLYLPQAKSYEGSCALASFIVPVGAGFDLDIQNLPIHLSIARNGAAAWEGETNTNQMKRSPADLAAYLFRELEFPHGAFLMTGTGIVPPDSFTLQSGDIVTITIDGVGSLTNPVA